MSALSRVGPLARKLLPKQAKRFILLHLLGGRRLKDHIRLRDSRVFLDQKLLPWIAQRYSRVLFVGTAPYSYQTERLFQRGREHYTTIDPVSAAATWGARNHLVAPIQEIGRHRPSGHFDCIVFNGVFGFGIDDLESERATIKILHDALAPGGLLLSAGTPISRLTLRGSACSSRISSMPKVCRGRIARASRCPRRTSTISTRGELTSSRREAW